MDAFQVRVDQQPVPRLGEIHQMLAMPTARENVLRIGLLFAALEDRHGLWYKWHVDRLAVLMLVAGDRLHRAIQVHFRPFHPLHIVFPGRGPDAHFQRIGGGGAYDP